MFLQTIFYSTWAFLQDIAVFLQVMAVFLPPIFCSTLLFLQDVAVFLQVMGVFLPPIFYITWAPSRTLPSSSSSLVLFPPLVYNIWAHLDDTAALFHATAQSCLRPFGFEWDPAVQHDPAGRPLGHPCVA